jgi:ATP-dependent Clp protease ATP-binding subunit ClpA
MIENFLKNIASLNKLDDKQRIGIGGFIFDVRITESVQFTSDVPDNYVEDGSFIHDHIINNPRVITIDGEVSDINVQAEFLPDILVKVIDKAESIVNNLYVVQKTQQMIQKIEKFAEPVTKAYDAINEAIAGGQQIYDFFNGRPEKTIQDEFFAFLNNIYHSKQLIDIEMPFNTYKNMRITSLTIIRDNTTQQALRYKLSAKEVRFAKTIFVDKNKYFKAPSKSSAGKVGDKENKGVVEGKKKSFLGTLIS